MHRLRWIIFLAVTVFYYVTSYAAVRDAKSVTELKSLLSQADENTLIVFDVDYTLVMPENPAFHRPNSWQHLDWIKSLQSELTAEEWAVYPGIFMFASPVMLIEADMPCLIQDLQKNQCHIIALTGSAVGEVGPISSVEDQRDKELVRLGIDLSQHFEEMSSTIFHELLPERGYYPLFRKGILSTNGDKNSKGAVLKAFLDKIRWTPSKIIFIDDKLTYLNSVEKMLEASEIEYVGIHYRAAEYVDTLPLSEEIIKKAWKEISLQAASYARTGNYIVVHALSHILEVYNADSSLIRAYPVGLGRNGIYKTREGDLKTPIGEYHILWKASRYAESDGGFLIAEEKAYCGKDNSFTPESGRLKGGIWGIEFGGDEAVFMCLDYPNSSDRAKGYTGYGIAIHAGQTGIGENSSAGCIRMHPADARDLYKRVIEGSTVFIANN